jgi:serine/threonine protein kinase
MFGWKQRKVTMNTHKFPQAVAMDFVVEHLLGEGSFGRVYLVHKRIQSGPDATCAMKVLDKVGQFAVEAVRQAQSEINLLNVADHVSFLVSLFLNRRCSKDLKRVRFSQFRIYSQWFF